MPLAPPAPLPSLTLRAQPPVYQPSNPVTFGSVRAAALAARQARQFRLKKQQEQLQGGLHRQTRQNTVNSAKTAQTVPFHEKKQLKLRLNMDAVAKPEAPPMFATAYVDASEARQASPIDDMPWEVMEDDGERTFGSTPSTNVHRPSMFRSRRQSSLVLSINSPEGAEFEEVAHDGPEQLGRLTKRVKRLGKGAGGVVFLSLYLPALKLVAVKEVVVYKEQERELVKHELHALHENLMPIDATQEVSSHPPVNLGVWTQLRMKLSSLAQSAAPSSASIKTEACPYLVGFYGAYLLPTKCAISIVMEFMDMGSVQDLLDARVSIPEAVLRHCAYCCMTALEHMHRHRTIHRDIKPANILMNAKGEFKIADFGLAGTLSKSESFFSEFEGTMMYMAPERIQGQPYTHVSDLWSMGVSLFYLATGAYPFVVEEGFFGLEEAIVNDPLPPMPNRFSPEYRDFVKGLLRRDPAQRTTAAQALAHPFLRGYAASDAFRSFPTLWAKMPLRHGAIKPEDTATIAQLMADFTLRQEERARRRSSGISKRSSMRVTGSALVDGDLKRFDSHALESLAAACGIAANELHHMYDRALARQS